MVAVRRYAQYYTIMRNGLFSILLFLPVLLSAQVINKFVYSGASGVDLSLGYISYYKFEDDYTDETGNYNGAGVNAPTFEADEKCGTKNVYFLDDDQASNTGTVNFTNTFTICYWVKMTNDARNQYMFANSAGTGSDGFWSYVTATGLINFRVSDGVDNSFASSDNGAIDFDVFEFVAIRVDKDADTVNFWVDGVDVTDDNSLTNYDFDVSGNNFYIGSTNVGSNGAIAKYDEFMIFDELLSVATLQNIYTNVCSEWTQ